MKLLTFGIATGVAVATFVIAGTQSSRAEDDSDECDVTTETDMKGLGKTKYYNVSGGDCFAVSRSIEKVQVHFDGGAELKYCTGSNGKINKARVIVTGDLNVPQWKGTASDEHTSFLKEYIAFLEAHEGRHAANLRAALDGAHKKVIGKSPEDGKAIIAKLECDAAKADMALDKKEGKVSVTLKSNDMCERTVSGRERPEYLAKCN